MFVYICAKDFLVEACYMLSHYAKNRRENKTTEPPPCVIYPKRGKGNARSKPGKNMVSRPKRMGSGVGYAKGRY